MSKKLHIIGIFPILASNFDKMEFSRQAKKFTEAPLTRQVILQLLKKYKRPNDKISELVKEGKLISLKKGLYIPGPNLEIKAPEQFVIANHLLGPSYISLESAMSHWGMIPERVYETSSVTTRLSKTYKTPIGRFSFQHIPYPYYSFGIRRVEILHNQVAMVASPEKALCDKIVATAGIQLRSTGQALEFLTKDLRIETETLRSLEIKTIHSWVSESPKKRSLLILIKTLESL